MRRCLVLAFALSLLGSITATAASIHEEMFVPIGGIQQWITITGQDRDNPAVLFLHGGPGDAASPFAASMFAGWDRDFTLVQWDQRGAGRTYGKTGPGIAPTMTLARMTQDGIEVAEYLASHLGKKKIILMGASWGSILGVKIVQARPDLFDAYVGTAQIVNWQKGITAGYARVLEMARSAHDEQTVSALMAIGPPPWSKLALWPKYRKAERVYQAKLVTAPAGPEAISPDYASPQERAQWNEADDFNFMHFVGMEMSGELMKVDLSTRTDFAVPVYIVQGEQDLMAPAELVRSFFESIRAPRKQLHIVPGTGHEPSAPSLEEIRKVLEANLRSRAARP